MLEQQIRDINDQDDKHTQVSLSNIFVSWMLGYVAYFKL